VTVRPFAPGAAAAATARWDAVFPDDRPWNASRIVLARKRARRDGLVWVASAGTRVVGAVMAGWDGQRGWIYHLAVAPAPRRGGVGRALVRHAERALRALGCPKINLQIVASNRDVVGFYERLGWRVEERVSMGKVIASARSASGDLSAARAARASRSSRRSSSAATR
jgi:ribosomal protein S18 acetylase RimI-like enzyme